jgi:Xaa-Pro aminopeptidase
MRYKELPSAFFSNNRKQIEPLLEDSALVILFSNDEMPRTGDQCFPFRQNSDLLYLSGIDQPKSIVVMCPQHPNPAFREILFIEQSTEQTIIWNGYKYTKEDACRISGINTVLWIPEFETILRDLLYHSQNIYIDIAEHPKFYSEIQGQQQRYAHKIKTQYPLHTYHRLFPLLALLRLVKSPVETDRIRKACSITEKAFNRAIHFVKPDVREWEVEAEITCEFIRNGVSAHAFAPIVAAGKNTCVLHYIDNNAVCKNGDLLLLDFGAEYANYASDLSRTIPVNGVFSPRQKQVYKACHRVYEYAKSLFVPGMTISKVYKKVCEAMQPELIELGLFTQADIEKQSSEYALLKNYFMHNISHFIGLDVHDVGTTDIVFEEGMVLSCEPGIYIAQEGIGVRIETTMFVASTPVDLMADVAVSVEDIEATMGEVES